MPIGRGVLRWAKCLGLAKVKLNAKTDNLKNYLNA